MGKLDILIKQFDELLQDLELAYTTQNFRKIELLQPSLLAHITDSYLARDTQSLVYLLYGSSRLLALSIQNNCNAYLFIAELLALDAQEAGIVYNAAKHASDLRAFFLSFNIYQLIRLSLSDNEKSLTNKQKFTFLLDIHTYIKEKKLIEIESLQDDLQYLLETLFTKNNVNQQLILNYHIRLALQYGILTDNISFIVENLYAICQVLDQYKTENQALKDFSSLLLEFAAYCGIDADKSELIQNIYSKINDKQYVEVIALSSTTDTSEVLEEFMNVQWVKYDLLNLLKSQDVVLFAEYITTVSEFILNSANSDLATLFGDFQFDAKQLHNCAMAIAAKDVEALQRCLIIQITQNYSKNILSSHDFTIFKEQVIAHLGLTSISLVRFYNTLDLDNNLHYQELALSVRKVANSWENINNYATELKYLAKCRFLLNFLPAPEESDSKNYHELYENLFFQWHMHTVRRSFGLDSMLQIDDANDVNCKISKLCLGAMVDHIQQFFLAEQKFLIHILENYVAKYLSQYNNKAKFTSILASKMYNDMKFIKNASSQEIEAMLMDDEIISFPVFGSSLMTDVVGEIQYKERDYYIYSHANVVVEPWQYSGIIFSLVEKHENIGLTIDKLAYKDKRDNTVISQEQYSQAVQALKLQELDRLCLPRQMVGNYGMAADVQPWVLQITIIRLLKEILRINQNIALKDALFSAENMALAIIDAMFEQHKSKSLSELINYVKTISHNDKRKMQEVKCLLQHIHVLDNNMLRGELIGRAIYDNISVQKFFSRYLLDKVILPYAISKDARRELPYKRLQYYSTRIAEAFLQGEQEVIEKRLCIAFTALQAGEVFSFCVNNVPKAIRAASPNKPRLK